MDQSFQSRGVEREGGAQLPSTRIVTRRMMDEFSLVPHILFCMGAWHWHLIQICARIAAFCICELWEGHSEVKSITGNMKQSHLRFCCVSEEEF